MRRWSRKLWVLLAFVLATAWLGSATTARAETRACSGRVDRSLALRITSPEADAQIDVAKTPEFVVAGMAGRNERSRIRSIDIYVGSARAGRAELQRRPGRLSFEFRMGAPAGVQTITACGRTTDGRVVLASVSVTVVWPDADDIVVDPDARLLSEAQMDTIKAVTPTSITFDGRAAVAPGDVLVGHGANAPEGLLRRVLDVRSSGASTVVRTANASLADLFLQAHINESFALRPAPEGKESTPRKKGRSKTEADTTAELPTFEVVHTLLEREIQGVNVAVDVRASGSLTVDLELDIDIGRCGLLPCPKVNSVGFKVEGPMKFSGNLTVAADKQVDLHREIPGLKIKTPRITIVIGGFPVTLSSVTEFTVGVRASVGVQHTFTWESAGVMTVGARWDRETGFGGSRSFVASGADTDGIDYQAEVKAEADVYIRPELDILVYDVVGPTFQLEAGRHWGLNFGDPMCPGEYSRGWYVKPVVGLKLAWVAKDLAEKTIDLPPLSDPTTTPLPWCDVTPPLEVVGRGVPDGTVGVAFNGRLQASGGKGPHQWRVLAGALPDGIALAPDGTLSGTPSRAATATFRVQVTDAEGKTAEAELTARVNPPLPPIEPGDGDPALPIVLRCSGTCALSWGDPHLTTFDGLDYDSQQAGEFVLARSTSGDLQVQVRQQPWGSSRVVSVNTAGAIGIAGRRLEVRAGASGPAVLLDGRAVTTGGVVALGGGASAETSADGRRVTAIWSDGSFLVLDYKDDGTPYLSLSAGLAETRAGLMRGLLGNGNASTTDDFVTRSGESLDVDPSVRAESIHDLADSWRITAAESLFTYRSGESTASFTDRDFPYGSITVESLPEQQRATARAACTSAGVNDEVFLDACILDVAVTGDAGAADVAATVEDGAALHHVISSDEVTPGVPGTGVPSQGYIFLDQTFRVSVPAGARLVLASRPDGTGEVHVDDKLQIDVTRPDGTTATFERGFEYAPPAGPLDLTGTVAVGANTLRVRLMDTVGGAYASTPLYLVVVGG